MLVKDKVMIVIQVASHSTDVTTRHLSVLMSSSLSVCLSSIFSCLLVAHDYKVSYMSLSMSV